MEASAIQVGPGLGRPRISLGSPLLRLRSDQQLVALFREGNEDAFRVIHDRYRPRLLTYVRQMLPGHPADAEDALQDVFMRTYAGLRTSERGLALRPWLYRVAHNRCIDELRRPAPVPELLDAHDWASDRDPVAETEQRETLQRLVIDIDRLPEQQRSALLMRELSGMAYSDVADALGVSVPAVKSLLVRARIGLAQAVEARDTACAQIRRELAEAHDHGVRPSWMARRHLRDCAGCRACRAEMRASSRRVAALVPTLGPLAALAKLFGVGTGAGGGTATAAGASSATAAGAGGTVTAASGLATVTVGHVATIVAAAVVTAGGAVAVQQTVSPQASRYSKHVAHQAAPAASAPDADAATMRMPAANPTAPAATHAPASRVRHATPAASSSPALGGWAQRAGGGAAAHQPTATVNNVDDISGVPAVNAASTTCTPPPTACTAAQPTTCTTGSGSGTTSANTTGSGTTSANTTGSGTTSANTTGSGTTSSKTTGPETTSANTTGSGSTTGPTIGTTGGTTSGTTSGTTTGTAIPACSTTTQSTATQGTQSTGQSGTGQTGTTQQAKPT